jgi:AraC-like DNA-binding protein
MNLDNLNPFIRYAKLHTYYNDQKKNSICYDCRLFFIAKGEGSLLANGQNYKISVNTAIYLPPKSQYSFSFEDNSSVKIFVLNFDLTDEFSSHKHSIGTATESDFNKSKILEYPLPQEFSSVIVKNNTLSFLEYLESCTNLFLEKPLFYRTLASGLIKVALIKLLQEINTESNEDKLVQTIQDYIKRNYHQAELSNLSISQKFNYHPYHLSRLMKAHTKKTLHNYLIDFRVQMAKNYLTTTTLNVTSIAEKTGFPSYTYFIKTFREKTGQSPLQYRKSHTNIGF